ncbi:MULTISPECIES: SitI3 family protein [Spirulina sp. CCY15215]|uniref:SitI3 family protein n=1 Tax=Spirulina sp. CCY15215 TaxID=2767591 RepID=UPI001951107C|nr:SitI3 family protein [Spirulina major]
MNMGDRTLPSQNLGGIPRGIPSQIGDNEDEETRRSLRRENESAITLAKAGYNMEWRFNKKMSLSYQLKISTAIEPSQVLEIISNKIDFEWVEKELENPTIVTSGMILGVNRVSEGTKNIIADAFGFIPQIDIWFRLNTNDPEYNQARKTLLLFILNILENLQGDAVFLFNYEITFLAKIENVMMFDRKMKNWFAGMEYEIDPQWKWLALYSPLLDNNEPTVRVSSANRNLLRKVAKSQNKNMRQVASKAIEIYLQKSDLVIELEQDILQPAIRIERGIHTRLKARASHFGQAMNQLANAYLERYLQQQESLIQV